MKPKDVTIATQLKLGFAALLLFSVVLGVVSYQHTLAISERMVELYDHPIQVMQSLNGFRADILSLHRDMKDLFLVSNKKELNVELDWTAWWIDDAGRHLQVIEDRYLGPHHDIDSVRKEFLGLTSLSEEIRGLMRSGQTRTVHERTKTMGILSAKVEILLATLLVVEKYATTEAETIKRDAEELRVSLHRQLSMLVVVILVLSLFMTYVLLKNIREPLNNLNNAAQRFLHGDRSARSSYALHNEFGVLSESFNSLAQTIQTSADVSEKVANLSALMLSEDDPRNFFRATLSTLSSYTNSQMAAVYLANEDKNRFECFESIGVEMSAMHSFAAGSFEGEFGPALASRTVQHIREIPNDTGFVFQTIGGNIIPREMITIPVLSGPRVIALISLASVSAYSRQSVQMIHSILHTLSARTEGVLAGHRTRQLAEKLEHQNRELDSQKKALSLQADELSRQNAELDMQKRQLDESNQLKSSFLSNMSHELRTPLNSVIALSGVLNRRLHGRIPAEEYSYLEVIERNGKNLQVLINDILDLSRIEAGREEICVDDFSVRDLVAEVVEMLEPQAREKNIRLLSQIGDELPVIRSDPEKCRHILQNLVGNAVKFTRAGQVEISAAQVERGLQIFVADTGIGIAADQIDRIFDEFRQGDESTTKIYGGTGLGLSIARKYAKLIDGNITAESTPGKGSIFTLHLPLAIDARTIDRHGATEKRTNSYASSPLPVETGADKTMVPVDDDESTQMQKQYDRRRTSGRPVILIVEDNPDDFLTAQALLKDAYTLVKAADGRSGVRQASECTPDIILMDLSLPVMDGFRAFDEIRRNNALDHIPVIALTASAMKGNREEILAYGFDGYLSKPIDSESLKETIREMLNGSY